MTGKRNSPIRIATRASRLASWQAHHVAELLRGVAASRPVEIVHISTLGDRDKVEPLHQLGTFGVFTREVQNALLDGRADIAVHSLKDLPTENVDGLVLGAVPQRASSRDVLVLPQGTTAASTATGTLGQLEPGARVGTGSLRRRAQLLHRRGDLELLEVRGNVETRLEKLDAGVCDALVLAEAGLRRLELADRISAVFETDELYPAVGQGALGIECREADDEVREVLSQIADARTLSAVTAERNLLARLRAGCHAPVGVLTGSEGERLSLAGVVLSPDGQQRLHCASDADASDAAQLGVDVADALLERGAGALIESARSDD